MFYRSILKGVDLTSVSLYDLKTCTEGVAVGMLSLLNADDEAQQRCLTAANSNYGVDGRQRLSATSFPTRRPADLWIKPLKSGI
jgi:hypothetical protein